MGYVFFFPDKLKRNYIELRIIRRRKKSVLSHLTRYQYSVSVGVTLGVVKGLVRKKFSL